MSAHHIIPLKTLISTTLALVVLTVVTVAVFYLNIPAPFDVIVALLLATFKATLVAMFFMGLYYDEKFNSVVLVFSIIFFLVFVGITLLDTSFRDAGINIWNP
ncbi:cytochrome c oxidase subunit 4 [Cyclonatronum proteinivorum]|uniref:Cytochrome c oxidase subunit 4 n=1 Tax=Cyclonatronum proteinivorum TaxID=1457365 RepID=A0A345UP10_9BACT|nr:cytochrome C oxidase subunit IV family protein [Cyclonatronum proteinivorum]AXJ02212.1 cytochrome c oxidase subunit 4 [Cyclonatronum proteinivorum]